jgi:hypothetical protein
MNNAVFRSRSHKKPHNFGRTGYVPRCAFNRIGHGMTQVLAMNRLTSSTWLTYDMSLTNYNSLLLFPFTFTTMYNITVHHRWALSTISVMSDIGLSLCRTFRYRNERLSICREFRYRTNVFSDIRYPTLKFLK